MSGWIKQLNLPVSSTPLVFLRIALGLLVAAELLGFWATNPFLENYYFNTKVHFAFPGFEWVPTLSGPIMKGYVIGLIGLLVVFATGWRYRIVSVLTFVFYGWFFLMERGAYLNHWYLNLLFFFLMMFVNAEKPFRQIPKWQYYILLFQVGAVYFFSGLAKFNSDWVSGATLLMHAQNFIGPDLNNQVGNQATMAIIGWAVAILEVMLPFTLYYKKTRLISFGLAAVFHIMNRVFFSIGVFPITMIAITALYFSPDSFDRVFARFKRDSSQKDKGINVNLTKPLTVFMAAYMLIQCLLPLRQHLYSENVLWTDKCVLFSWRMFTAAKMNRMNVLVYNRKTAEVTVFPVEELLTNGQLSKTMRSPDMMLQMAHHIGDYYSERKEANVEVHIECENALNGRGFQKFVNVEVDLLTRRRQLFLPYDWVLPLQD